MLENENRGSTTVFLCLISVVMLTIIVAVTGMLQKSWSVGAVKRETDISVEAEFSKYYRPLFDRYRLFYYVETKEDKLAAGIMSYFKENQKNMPGLLKLNQSGISVTDKMYATDDSMNNVKKQMSDGVKYVLGEKVFNSALGRYDSYNDTNLATGEKLGNIENDIENNLSMSAVEKEVLKLLGVVEGITIKNGKISCCNEFVKMGIYGKVTAKNAGIDSELVWKEVRPYDWNIAEELEILCHNNRPDSGRIDIWKQYLMTIRKKTIEAEKIAERIIAAISGDTSVKLICDVNAIRDILRNNKSILDYAIEFAEVEVPSDKIQKIEYRKQALQCKKIMEGYDVSALSFDYSLLELSKEKDPRPEMSRKIKGILSLLIKDEGNISGKSVKEADIYNKLSKEYEAPDHRKDTSDFMENTDSLKDFVGKCKGDDGNTLTDRLAMLVYFDTFFDAYTESKSDIAKNYKVEDTIADDNGNKTEDKTNGKSENSSESNSENSPESNSENKNKSMTREAVYEKALMYEREYLLAGDISDKENLKKVVEKILLQRTGVSLVYLVSDSNSSGLAYATAAALVGFTGMDALIRCVQYGILAGWAYEEACVDTAYLLAGKKINPVKTASNMNVAYKDLCLFGKEYIENKVNQYSDNTGNGSFLGYTEYLQMMLMAKNIDITTCRAMDLIQFNIKKNYSNRFTFLKCIYGAKVCIYCDKPYESAGYTYFAYQ